MSETGTDSAVLTAALSSEVANFQNNLFPTEFSYTVVEFTGSPSEYQATLSITMNTVDDVDLWKTKFEAKTQTTYTTRTSSVKLGRMYCAVKTFKCHRNTRSYTTNPEKISRRNTDCPASVVMKLHRKKPLSKQHICMVTINFSHNHAIQGADALQFKKPSKEIEQKFLELFSNGQGVASALHTYLMNLLLEHPENYDELAADRSVNPDYQWVSRLHKKYKQGCSTSDAIPAVQCIEGTFATAVEKDGQIIIIQEIGDEFNVAEIAEVEESNVEDATPQSDTNQHIVLYADASMQTNSEIDDVHLSMLNDIIEDVSTRLQDKPDLYGPALAAFHKSYFKLSNDAYRVSAFHTFAKQSQINSGKSSELSVKETGTPLGLRRSLKDHTYGSAEKTAGNIKEAAARNSSAQAGTDSAVAPNPETVASSSNVVGNENPARKKKRSILVTGYNMFFKELHEQHEGGKTCDSFRAIAKSASEKWRSLSPNSKQRYTASASSFNTRALESTMNWDNSKQVLRFQCTKCSRRFKHFHHFRSHSGECGMSHPCSKCAKSFNSRANLLRHISQVHDKKRNYQCETCRKSFYSRFDLEVHSRIHNGARPFACKLCDKKFYVKSNMRRHEKLHCRNNVMDNSGNN